MEMLKEARTSIRHCQKQRTDSLLGFKLLREPVYEDIITPLDLSAGCQWNPRIMVLEVPAIGWTAAATKPIPLAIILSVHRTLQ
jgi:hypothetical protein